VSEPKKNRRRASIRPWLKVKGGFVDRNPLEFAVQTLESRIMPAPVVSSPTTVTFSVAGDVLTYGWNEAESQTRFGTPAADITLATSGDLPGYLIALGPNIGGNPNFAAVELAGINRIVVNGTNFGDRILVQPTLTLNFELNGFGGDDLIAGAMGADRISGGSGIDQLIGNDGGDTVFGGADMDTIVGGFGNDVVFGDGGNDTIIGSDPSASTASGESDELHGGDGDDTILGSPGPDRIFGDENNDTLVGGLGSDDIRGGSGNDVMQGQEGADTLLGEAGNDTLIGGVGNDVLRGGANDDTLFGDDPNDVSLSGADELFGDADRDLLFGGNQNDSLFGGDGADGLFGDNGDDTLVGADQGNQNAPGDGNDFLSGGEGNDDLFGGSSGNGLGTPRDIPFPVDGNGNPLQVDFLSGDGGNDELVGQNGPDLLDGGIGTDNIQGNEGDDTLLAGAGTNDMLFGGNGADTLLGGDAAVLRGEEGDDILVGTDFAESFFGGGGNDVVTAAGGNDSISGDADNDVLLGDAGDDSIDGGIGNDVLVGGDGNDSQTGGDGDDTYLFLSAATPEVDTIAEAANGGTDIVDMRPLAPATGKSTNHAGVSLATSPNRTLNVAAAGQQLNIEFGLNIDPFVEWIEKPTWGVTFQPLRFVANVVDVGTQMGHVVGFVFGDGEVSTFNLNGTNGRGTVDVTHEYQSFGLFRQALVVVDVGGNQTVLTNSVAINEIAIAPDRDFPQFTALYIGGSVGNDDIIFSNGTLGRVNVSIRGRLFQNLDFVAGIYVYAGSGNDRVTLPATMTRQAFISGGSGDDFLRGGGVGDTLLGDSGNDTIFGADGPDFIDGSAGNDTLQGDAGNDVILGGLDDDLLFGNAGRDLLIGQQGIDTLTGGADPNILIGGTTSHDNDRAALRSIQAELRELRGDGTQISAYIGNLTNGGGLNGSVVLVLGVTVFDDTAVDTMNAAAGSHWIFAGIGDVLQNVASDDVVA
jgi:Ca2+-binding RTX toxin-like protein